MNLNADDLAETLGCGGVKAAVDQGAEEARAPEVVESTTATPQPENDNTGGM